MKHPRLSDSFGCETASLDFGSEFKTFSWIIFHGFSLYIYGSTVRFAFRKPRHSIPHYPFIAYATYAYICNRAKIFKDEQTHACPGAQDCLYGLLGLALSIF